jgi:hypothetical protein
VGIGEKIMSKTGNKIIDIQEIVYRQLKRLDDDKIMEEKGAEEIARSNVISNNAQTFIKSVNTNLKIMEMAERQGHQTKKLTEELGLID